ncbi:hypothetical protein PQX77_018400, partial [Marasmius sp. AFHP31]
RNMDLDQNNELTGMARQLAEMVQEDKDDLLYLTLLSASSIRISIADLFDFTSMAWTEVFQCNAQKSFEEELELYELVDCDSAGKDSVEIGIDDGVQAVLE